MTTYALYILAALYLGLLTSISPSVGDQHRRDLVCGAEGRRYKAGRQRGPAVHAGTLPLVPGASRPADDDSLVDSRRFDLPAEIHAPGAGARLPGAGHVSGGADHGLRRRDDDEPADAETRRRDGHLGALLLGVFFALSFCPTSAAWFFGLVALIMGSEAGAITGVLERVGIDLPQASLPGGSFVLPLVYGIGTGVPVLVVAFLLAYSVKSVGKTYNVLSKVEWWARMITGWLFIFVGIWFSLTYVFELR